MRARDAACEEDDEGETRAHYKPAAWGSLRQLEGVSVSQQEGADELEGGGVEERNHHVCERMDNNNKVISKGISRRLVSMFKPQSIGLSAGFDLTGFAALKG